jgi:hypothetical protein
MPDDTHHSRDHSYRVNVTLHRGHCFFFDGFTLRLRAGLLQSSGLTMESQGGPEIERFSLPVR